VVPEPLGGAHQNHQVAADNLKRALLSNLDDLARKSIDKLLQERYQKFRSIGPVLE